MDETFDVGVDTRTGVDDKDYQVPFRFSGKLDKLTVKLEPMKAAEEKLLQQRAQRHERQSAVNRSASSMTPANARFWHSHRNGSLWRC